MKTAFASMDTSKIKPTEKTKADHKSDAFKPDNLKVYPEKVADELMDNITRANQNERKQQSKLQKRTKLNVDGYIGPKTVQMLEKYGFKK